MLKKSPKSSNSLFYKVAFYSGLSTLIKVATSFLTNKIVAIYLGPIGMGLLGQLNSLLGIITPLSTGGTNTGVIKYVSEFDSNQKYKQQQIITTSFFLSIICSIAIAIALFSFAERLAVFLFLDINYSYLLNLTALATPFMALNVWSLAVINGLKEFKKFNAINIVSSITGLGLTILLAVFYSIEGALVANIIIASITCCFSFPVIFKRISFTETLRKSNFSRNKIKLLGNFALMALVTAFTTQIVQVIIRNYISSNLNLVSLGLWEGLNRISGLHLMFITTTLNTYYLPKLAALVDNKMIKQEVFRITKIVVPIVFLTSITIYFLRNPVIKIAFSNDFIASEPLFMFQLVGDFLKIIGWLFAMLFLAKAKLWAYLLGEIIFSFTLYFLSVFLIDYFGLIGMSYAYAINYLLYLIYCILLFNHYMNKE